MACDNMKKNSVKVKCPAKINLDLRVFRGVDEFGFHKIKSIMQSVSLYDYITISAIEGEQIVLEGNSKEIPYDKTNLCYRAAEAFFERVKMLKNNGITQDCPSLSSVKIYIEKNIPVCAGLAGGSTDAAGVLVGLNTMFCNILPMEIINEIAASLGSDINFCLYGGTKLCSSRGESIVDMPFFKFDLTLVKPKSLVISTKRAYEIFDDIFKDPKVESNIRNDLEFALIQSGKFPQINYLSELNLQMSGSGPAFFVRESRLSESMKQKLKSDEYLVFEGLKSTEVGVEVIEKRII